MYSLLETINSPADLRRLPRNQLKALADELRAYVLDSVSKTGGHWSSNLVTVELPVALHYVLNTPYDRRVWAVGHQPYPTKTHPARRDPVSRAHLFAARPARRPPSPGGGREGRSASPVLRPPGGSYPVLRRRIRVS